MIKLLTVAIITILGLNGNEGFEEVNAPNGKEYSHVICEVKSNEYHSFENGDGLIPCDNVEDFTDFILLDESKVSEGELVYVVFYHDDVHAMEVIQDYEISMKIKK